jgi:hypothetical protein
MGSRDETPVEMRMYDRKIFTVEYQQHRINSPSPAQAEVTDASNPG